MKTKFSFEFMDLEDGMVEITTMDQNNNKKNKKK